MVEIIEPPSEIQDFALLLAVILCFILIATAIYFTINELVGSATFSLVGAAFFVFVIWAMKGAFRK